jgi:hypothetical protein
MRIAWLSNQPSNHGLELTRPAPGRFGAAQLDGYGHKDGW